MSLSPKEIKILLQKENPLILEIGAYIGTDTKQFLSEFKDIKIYCFEPDPRCIKLFRKNIRDDRCVLIEAAVSNIDGKSSLNLAVSFPLSHKFTKICRIFPVAKPLFSKLCYFDQLGQASIVTSISNSEDYPFLVFKKRVECKTIKLSTWIKEKNIDFIDFIWSDVQGSEKRMIEGASEALKITKYFYTEYGETSSYPEALTRNETIELLRKYNFVIVPKYSDTNKIGNLLFKNTNLA